MGKLRIIIFHVEHGFCAFVRSPNDYTLLIDCGATKDFSPIKYILEKELAGANEYEGYKLTKFILTHPHDDHLTDIERLTNNFEPYLLMRQHYNWDQVKEGDKEQYENLDTYSEWQETYTPGQTPPPDWGMSISHGDYLSPSQAKAIEENKFINNSSIPTFIEYKGYKIVFPGDLEQSGWLELLNKQTFRNALKGCSFFVTSHHGHSSGYCKEIYESMGKPHFNIVSTHKGDESVESAYSKPENARGVEYDGKTRYMFSTRNDGSIVIEVTEDGKCTYNFLDLPNNLSTQTSRRYY